METLLGELSQNDPSIIIPPRIGEDAAAIRISESQILILKSDPVTFATDRLGDYAITVCANDVATTGAKPRWFLATMLFPPKSTTELVESVFQDVQTAAADQGITLCGGHTEITDSVTRPVIIGMMAGTVSRERLVEKGNLQKDNILILTKKVAVEGTALIAREFPERLQKLGMSREEILRCAGFLNRLSILEDASIALDSGGVTALHDITEGGLAAAVDELSVAGNHRIRIDFDAVPIYPETKRIAGLLGLDSLGLIGSGSLLIGCVADSADTICNALHGAGIEAQRIGRVLEPGIGVEAIRDREVYGWPEFLVDEITKLYS